MISGFRFEHEAYILFVERGVTYMDNENCSLEHYREELKITNPLSMKLYNSRNSNSTE